MAYQKKNKTIIFKVSSEEHEKLLKKQEGQGFSHLSEYIRFKLFDTKQENMFMQIMKALRILEERK